MMAGEPAAAEYRFFRLNMAGIVDAAERIRLSDDAIALDHARGFSQGFAVEVWRGDRMLGKVPPQRASAQAVAAKASTKWRRHIAT